MSAFLLALLEINIAAAAAIVLVLAVRKLALQRFGARPVYLMWAIVPAAMLATLIPSRTTVAEIRTINLPDGAPLPVASLDTVEITAGVGWLALTAPWIFALWCVGGFAMGFVLTWRQDLFTADMASGKAGPAVVGFLHPRVITPDDFRDRFSPREQNLIIAHEQVHLERQDARINAAAALARCLFWFNPLVHVGVRLMRVDQELSCDAAVIERRPRARRAYAETLLKTQLATRHLPVGCYWPGGPQHPLTERIAMLARTPFSMRRRIAASVAVLTLTAGAGLAAWAAQPERIVLPNEIEAPPAAPVEAGDTPELLVPFQALTPGSHWQADPPPAPQQVFRAAAVDTRPRPGPDFAPPPYPGYPEFKDEGETTVELCVDSSGVISEVKLVKSSGSQRLDDATISGLTGNRLQPATKDGQPVAVCGYKLTYVWEPSNAPEGDEAGN
jgi:TonB family protein